MRVAMMMKKTILGKLENPFLLKTTLKITALYLVSSDSILRTILCPFFVAACSNNYTRK